MGQRLEGLAGGVDGLDALLLQHAEHLGVHRGDAVHELLELGVAVGGAGVLDGALDVVDHGEQVGHQLLGGALLLRQSLGGGAAAEVLPVRLEAQHALRGVRGLLLGGLDLVLHVRKLLLELIALLANLARVGSKLTLRGLLAGTDGGLHAGALLGLLISLLDVHDLGLVGLGLGGILDDGLGLHGLVLLVLNLDGHLHVTLLDCVSGSRGVIPPESRYPEGAAA